jgi:hypothetical protein
MKPRYCAGNLMGEYRCDATKGQENTEAEKEPQSRTERPSIDHVVRLTEH